MAVLFTAFFSALSSGASAVGSAGAAAAGAAGSVASAGGGFAAFASGLSTVVGGLASIAAGSQQKAALDQQAMDEDMRASQETLNGRQAAVEAMQKLNENMGSILVAGYSSGLQSSGSVEVAQEEAKRIGEQNISTARETGRMQSAARRSQARQLRIEGKGAMTSGIFGAIEGGLSLFSRKMARG
jgi:hypothetical protein